VEIGQDFEGLELSVLRAWNDPENAGTRTVADCESVLAEDAGGQVY